MGQDPAQRYPDAVSLNLEVGRFLDGLSVEAYHRKFPGTRHALLPKKPAFAGTSPDLRRGEICVVFFGLGFRTY